MKEFRVIQGGDLITGPSSNNVPPYHYTEKWNIRRVQDREELAPGWEQWYQLPLGADTGTITLVAEVVRLNGDQAVIAATSSHVYRFNKSTESWQVIGSGYSSDGHRWEAVNLNGYIVLNNGVDLPFSYRVEDDSVTPLRELRESGVVSVGTTWTSLGMLFLGDVTEIREDRVREWLTESPLPYGQVPKHLHTRTPWRIIWSDSVHQWRLPIRATTSVGSSIINLDYPSMSFKPGDLVSFTEADLSTEIDLDSHTEMFTRVKIVQVNGTQIEIEGSASSTSTGFLYPANFFEQIVGFDDPETDGAILRGYPLGERQIIFKERSILVGTATGDSMNPFIFETAYQGLDGLYMKWMVQAINDRTIIYRSRERWFAFDLINQKPTIVPKLDMVRDQFKFGPEDSEDCFTANNVTDREMWICTPNVTVVYNYEVDRVHMIDAGFTAAHTLLHPHLSYESGVLGRMFLIADEGGLHNYGRGYFTGDVLYTRNGEPYMGSVTFGTFAAEQGQDVIFSGFRLIPSDLPDVAPYTVSVRHRRNPNDELIDSIPPVFVSDPARKSLVQMHRQAGHFVVRVQFSDPMSFVGFVANYKFANNTLKGWM